MNINIKYKTMKLVAENIRENLWVPALAKKVLDETSKI